MGGHYLRLVSTKGTNGTKHVGYSLKEYVMSKLTEHLKNYWPVYALFGIPIVSDITCWALTGYNVVEYFAG